MPQGYDRDDVVDRLNELAETIRLRPAATMDEVVAKARSVLWSFGLTHAGVPSIDGGPGRHELAPYVEQFEAFTRVQY